MGDIYLFRHLFRAGNFGLRVQARGGDASQRGSDERDDDQELRWFAAQAAASRRVLRPSLARMCET